MDNQKPGDAEKQATNLPCFSCQYGEQTKVDITVKSVEFVVHALPQQGQSLIEAIVVLVNDAVHRAIEGSVRFPLPNGGSVVRYGFEIGGEMVDAVALTNRKVAEVAYKEKEAGRNVSKTEKVEGNLFEYQKPSKLIIAYTAPLVRPPESASWETGAPFRFSKPAQISAAVKVYPDSRYTSIHNIPGANSTTELTDGFKVSVSPKDATQKEIPNVIFGKYLDKTHFSAFVGREYLQELFGPQDISAPKSRASGEKNICVLWDSSQSLKPTANQPPHLQFFKDMEEAYAQKNEKVKFTVISFSTDLNTVGKDLTAEQVLAALNSISYDGGTNLAVLGSVFTEQKARKTNYDAFIVYTDGVDNIGDGTRIPDGISPEFGTPIHIITPENQTVNDNLLRCITTQTKAHLGHLTADSAQFISQVKEDYVVIGIMPVIEGKSDENGLIDLFEAEDFTTVPDWRLGDRSWWPLKSTGVLVSGTLPASTKATPNAFEFTFLSTTRGKKTVRIPFSLTNEVHSDEVGRLIGVLHCHNVIEESRSIRFDPEFSRDFIEKTASVYNIASDYTSLLLLHSAVQFLDNDIECPASHPEHKVWKQMEAKRKTSIEIKKISDEIGRLKKMSSLQPLVQKLITYYTRNLSLMEEEQLGIAATNAKIAATDEVAKEISTFFETGESALASIWEEFSNPLRITLDALKSIFTDLALDSDSLAREWNSHGGKGDNNENREMQKMYTAIYERIAKVRESIDPSKVNVEANKKLAEADRLLSEMKKQVAGKKEESLKELRKIEEQEKAKLAQLLENHNKLVRETNDYFLKAYAQTQSAIGDASKRLFQLQNPNQDNMEAKSKEKADKDTKENKEADNDSDEEEEKEREEVSDRSMRRYCMKKKSCAKADTKIFCESKEGPSRKRNEPMKIDHVAIFKSFADTLTTTVASREHKAAKKQEELEAALNTFSAIQVTAEKAFQDLVSSSKIAELTTNGLERAIQSSRNKLRDATKQKRQELQAQYTRDNKIRAASNESDKTYLAPVRKELLVGQTEAAYAEYLVQRETGSNALSPSFYIYNSRLFHAAECDKSYATKIVTNCLEINIQDAQMFRTVAYFMLEIGSTDEAIIIFRRVQDKSPGEPQSFMDLGMALFFDARKRHKNNTISKEKLASQLREAIDNIGTVLVNDKWPNRFSEIEWPALIWINWMVSFAKYALNEDFWPAKVEKFCHVKDIHFDLVVALAWDTDWIDIDLHTHEPDGSHVYYSSNTSSNGGYVSRDFREGYGPECYIIKRATQGFYDIRAQYFSSHQASSLTGTTSCCLWSVKWLGHFDKEEMDFRMVRLEKNSSNILVWTIDMVL